MNSIAGGRPLSLINSIVDTVDYVPPLAELLLKGEFRSLRRATMFNSIYDTVEQRRPLETRKPFGKRLDRKLYISQVFISHNL